MLDPEVETRPWAEQLALDDESYRAQLEYVLERSPFYGERLFGFRGSGLADIAELQLERLRSRLRERKLSLELTDTAKEVLAEAGWDPTYGARPLKRALQRLVENPLAQRLLEAEGDTIRIDAQNGELVFGRAEAPLTV